MSVESLRADRNALLAEIASFRPGAVRNPSSIHCPLPGHADKHASGSTYRGEDGAWRFKCHGCSFCGDIFDLRAACSGKPLPDVLRDASGRQGERQGEVKPTRSYPDLCAIRRAFPRLTELNPYTNPDTGEVELVTIRLPEPDGGKRFLQFRPCSAGFELGAPPKPWPIGNRKAVKEAREVVVVEGEKCARALQAAGIVATTSPAGAGKAKYADWSLLAGKRIVLWPDNDEKGRDHMGDVAEILSRLLPSPTVFLIDPAHLDVPETGDAADWLEINGAENVRLALDMADPIARPSAPLRELLDQTIARRRRNVPWGRFARLTSLTRALLPGTVTVVWGAPGDGKSFLLLQSVADWAAEGESPAYHELEEDKAWHLNRALAQYEGNANLLDPCWVAENPDATNAAYERNVDALDRLAQCIWAAPDDVVTLRSLGEWVEARAKDGHRIVVVDPVTAAHAGDKRWNEDMEFVLRCKMVARKYECRVVLVSHPDKPGKEMAGGAAYRRHVQTVLRIRKHKDGTKVMVRTLLGRTVETCNRSVVIDKARNGRADGLELAFSFDRSGVVFRELGIVDGKRAWKEAEEVEVI